MNLMSAEMQVYLAKFEMDERLDRARSYHANANIVRTKRTRFRRVRWGPTIS